MQDLWNVNEQRGLAPLNVPGASSAGSVRVVSGSGFRYVVPFPYRLHEMLSNFDTKHDGSIVSWLPDGRHFKVHDPKRFVDIVIPSAFKQKSLKSFQRQLHLYGFQRVPEGADKGAYYHEKFRRDDRDMCLTITRTKAPKRSRAAPSKTTTWKKAFTPAPIPSFQKSLEQSNVTLAMPAVSLADVTVSPSIVDHDVTPQQQSMPDNCSSMKGPLHKATISVFPLPNRQTASNPVFTQQSTNHTQQLDSSVVDTCQWLINAGVPMSAFDPVSIGDTLNSTPLCVPQVGPQTPSTFAPVIPQTNNTLPVVMTQNVAVPAQVAPLANNVGGNTQHLNLNCGNDIASIFSIPTVSNSVSPTHEEELCFDDDHFLNDLLPGEGLVDESLWAL